MSINILPQRVDEKSRHKNISWISELKPKFEFVINEYQTEHYGWVQYHVIIRDLHSFCIDK